MQYTNFERIKNMSVEELAEFIYSGNECGFCNQFGVDTERKCDGDCVECIKHWLGLKCANNRPQINYLEANEMKFTLDSGAFAPTRAHKTDAGLDLRSPICIEVPANGSVVIDTGVHG